jgi:hypothetical protein
MSHRHPVKKTYNFTTASLFELLKLKKKNSWVWYHTSVIPALRRQRQENHVSYIAKPCLKIPQKSNEKAKIPSNMKCC